MKKTTHWLISKKTKKYSQFSGQKKSQERKRKENWLDRFTVSKNHKVIRYKVMGAVNGSKQAIARLELANKKIHLTGQEKKKKMKAKSELI